jgi:hypothetical protein
MNELFVVMGYLGGQAESWARVYSSSNPTAANWEFFEPIKEQVADAEMILNATIKLYSQKMKKTLEKYMGKFTQYSALLIQDFTTKTYLFVEG